MLDTTSALATASRWVGKTYAEMDAIYPRIFQPRRPTAPEQAARYAWEAGARGCWSLVRAAFSLRGVEIPEEYHAALDARLFRTVFDPQPFDIVPICNHRLPIVTHVALVLPDSLILHALETYGVVAQPLTRDPWWSRIARDRDGRRGYLRLRTSLT